MSKLQKGKFKNIFGSKFRLFALLFSISVIIGASCAGLYVYTKSQKKTSTPVVTEGTTTKAPAPVATTPKPTKKTPPKTTTVKKPVVPVVVAKVATPAPQSKVDALHTTTTNQPVAPTTPPPSPTAPVRTSSIRYSSTNWSGYLATGGSFKSVNGAWIAPSATGVPNVESADGSWIGIGGVTTNDLIQVGTANSISSDGTVSTDAFYELLPAPPQYIQSMTISPGDSISASITETSTNLWLIVINDLTTGESFSRSVSYGSSYSSAEWIEEAPSYSNGSLVPLDYFGTVSFSGCSSMVDGFLYTLSNIGASPITMVTSKGSPIAIPSSLYGNGFRVTRN